MGIVIHTSKNDSSSAPLISAGAGAVIRTMVALMCLLGLTACGGQRYNTFFVETSAKPYWKALAKPAPYPLARTLTWKYYFTSDPGNYQAFVADGKVVSNKSALLSMSFFATKPATTGVRMSDVYALRAREAERSGQRHMRDAYQMSSEVALRTEIANQRIEVGLALGNALVGLADGLVKAVIDENALTSGMATAAYFTSGAPRGAIGDQAPPGTLLELYFRLKANASESWDPLTVKRRFEVVATLVDADGALWRSIVVFDGYLVQASKPTVPQELDTKHVLVNASTLIPFRDPPGDYVAELGEISRMPAGTMYELALAGAQAIHGLYEQIEAVKERAAPPMRRRGE